MVQPENLLNLDQRKILKLFFLRNLFSSQDLFDPRGAIQVSRDNAR